jgi:hypothetical protein
VLFLWNESSIEMFEVFDISASASDADADDWDDCCEANDVDRECGVAVVVAEA